MGWLDNFLPKQPYDEEESSKKRQEQYPEQYPATYELSTITVESDDAIVQTILRPLLLGTQLQSRALKPVYDADIHGWNAQSFHDKVDGCGASIVLGTVVTLKGGDDVKTYYVGGYNPKGWASYGGARPSVAAFLFYSSSSSYQKLQKVGGGGLAISKDDPNYGIAFGPDGLVISFVQENKRLATSKLGTYYERGPDHFSSLFDAIGGGSKGGGVVELDGLKVYTGVYENGEDIPYSGAVLDMTSG
mmetsp:Transcript_37703/g.55254  ORF Transcript_37703/g.55254 Transcript_37703/m.55254 type:complete len:246 (-) Transcript_37703:155-892(-)